MERRDVAVIVLAVWLMLTSSWGRVSGQALDSFEVLLENAGISSMHTAVTHMGTVLMLDQTNIGPSKISLADGVCRDDSQDKVLKHDCTAHSVEFSLASNQVRPLFIQTNTWCSSGQFDANGTMVQTGGDDDGNRKIRSFQPCHPDGLCDWVELTSQRLQAGRWYATNQILPGGRQIVVGGRDSLTYEFVPGPLANGPFSLDLLRRSTDSAIDTFYPFVHLLPDGNLFIFANNQSVLYDYNNHVELRQFPALEGGPRNYPSAGSSAMLALEPYRNYKRAEILVCGGATPGAYASVKLQFPAQTTCGRLRVTDPNATWERETMPFPRVMGDMVNLPTKDILIINGAQNGTQGWGYASNPALHPVLYRPYDQRNRFTILSPTTIPRMYHSTANLLPDGRILLAGSNTHQNYTFEDTLFPTELRVEAYSPPYLNSTYDYMRPAIVSSPQSITYLETFSVHVSLPHTNGSNLQVNIMSAPFVTHSFAQGQRLVNLDVIQIERVKGRQYRLSVIAPPRPEVAPGAYYMLFVVNTQPLPIPSVAAWVQLFDPSL